MSPLDNGAIDELLRDRLRQEQDAGSLTFQLAKKVGVWAQAGQGPLRGRSFCVTKDAVLDMDRYINRPGEAVLSKRILYAPSLRMILLGEITNDWDFETLLWGLWNPLMPCATEDLRRSSIPPFSILFRQETVGWCGM